ncbi:MAG: 5-oxoprolinase subunit PxpB [Dehalococcoidia bacterium]|jgi:KipI family sensor histidine kinase inhibitor
MNDNQIEELVTFPIFKMQGDSALNVYLGSEISSVTNDKVHFLSDLLKNENWPGIKEIIPSYVSLTIHYDPFVVDYLSVEGFIKKIFNANDKFEHSAKRILVIPTFYGGEFAPDMESVSSITGLSTDQVIKTHTSKDYKVYSIGFTPGFPYLGGLDETLYCPRLESPRTAVPLGSVAIAESQTGIYPSDSPGGWRIIGATPIQLFDSRNSKPALLEPGDLVRFKPLNDENEFKQIKENAKNGEYQLEEILL